MLAWLRYWYWGDGPHRRDYEGLLARLESEAARSQGQVRYDGSSLEMQSVCMPHQVIRCASQPSERQ
jgi:hypothetical protein